MEEELDLKIIYQSENRNFGLYYNKSAEFYIIKTDEGVTHITKEIKERMTKDSKLVQAITEYILH